MSDQTGLRLEVNYRMIPAYLGVMLLAFDLFAVSVTLEDVDGDAATVALNWYLNPNTRVMLDVTQAELDTLDTTTIVALRFAFDF